MAVAWNLIIQHISKYTDGIVGENRQRDWIPWVLPCVYSLPETFSLPPPYAFLPPHTTLTCSLVTTIWRLLIQGQLLDTKTPNLPEKKKKNNLDGIYRTIKCFVLLLSPPIHLLASLADIKKRNVWKKYSFQSRCNICFCYLRWLCWMQQKLTSIMQLIK